MEKEKLTKLANEFIEKCEVTPLVYAKEGGVINLDSILIDFVKYIESEEDKLAKQNLFYPGANKIIKNTGMLIGIIALALAWIFYDWQLVLILFLALAGNNFSTYRE